MISLRLKRCIDSVDTAITILRNLQILRLSTQVQDMNSKKLIRIAEKFMQLSHHIIKKYYISPYVVNLR